MNLPPAWRVRPWTWALPLVFALANATLLLVHPGRTGAGFADMEKALASETDALAELSAKEARLERVLDDARSSRHALEELYSDRFATQAERLTLLITEVKRLAQRAGLEPAAISYPEESIDEYGLVRMSLVFGVQGTYSQLRSLINLIELSDLFLVLERVAVRDAAGGGTLGIDLEISTFFVREPEDTARRTGASAAPRPGRPDAGRRPQTRGAAASGAPAAKAERGSVES